LHGVPSSIPEKWYREIEIEARLYNTAVIGVERIRCPNLYTWIWKIGHVNRLIRVLTKKK
jgi:hypothetical protein